MTAGTAEQRMAELYSHHSAPLLRFLNRLTRGERQAAEDMLQETMMRAWRHVDTLPAEGDGIRQWLYTVARRIAIDASRVNRRHPEVIGLDGQWSMAAPDNAEAALAHDAVHRAFRALSPAHRDVLTRVYLKGDTIKQAAHALGIPPGTVKSRAYYALHQLRDELSK